MDYSTNVHYNKCLLITNMIIILLKHSVTPDQLFGDVLHKHKQHNFYTFFKREF